MSYTLELSDKVAEQIVKEAIVKALKSKGYDDDKKLVDAIFKYFDGVFYGSFEPASLSDFASYVRYELSWDEIDEVDEDREYTEINGYAFYLD